MRKYQFGDSNTDFFNMLADRYAQQFNQTEDSTPEYTVDENQSPDDAPDYQDLLDKYGDLESRFNQLSDQVQSGLPYGQSYNDNFLDFLFSDDNKLPIDFSNEDLSGSTKSSNSGFRTFDNYQEGRNALENQLDLYKTGRTRNLVTPNSTLYEAMNVYAPAADHNNPKAYAEFIAKKLGVSPDTPISKLDTKKWADAVEQMEGNKTGHNPGNLRYQFGGNTPIYTSNPNDPRLKAYQDSLILNNYSDVGLKALANAKNTDEFNKYWKAQPNSVTQAYNNLGNPKPIQQVEKLLPYPDGTPSSSPSGVNYYKKPVQPVVYQNPNLFGKAISKPQNNYYDITQVNDRKDLQKLREFMKHPDGKLSDAEFQERLGLFKKYNVPHETVKNQYGLNDVSWTITDDFLKQLENRLQPKQRPQAKNTFLDNHPLSQMSQFSGDVPQVNVPKEDLPFSFTYPTFETSDSQNTVRFKTRGELYDWMNKNTKGPMGGTDKTLTGYIKQFGGYKSYNPNAAKNDLNFQTWYNKYTIEGRHDIPFTEHLDYDYYSYYKNGDYVNYDGGHFPDTYKRPNHSTFSDESIYSIPENKGGHWQGDKFIPVKKMQIGGNLEAANKEAKRFAVSRGLISGEDTYVDSIPKYVDLKGRQVSPSYTNIPKSLISQYVPSDVKSLEWDAAANLPYFIDPNTSNIMYTKAENFYLPRFQHKQFGGPTVDSPEDLIRGLNNPYYAQMKQLNLKLPRQQNLIRGLDNNKPVSITDELGNTGILKGKNDKKYFFGSVHEKIL